MQVRTRQARRGLRVLAGPAALAELNRDGFNRERIRSLAGASGGPKWLVLSGLDPQIAESVMANRCSPIDLIGSSIGAWRMACFAKSDPRAALAEFSEAYLGQTYSERPDRHEITKVSLSLVQQLLGPGGAAQVLEHDQARLHILTVRSRLLTRSDQPALLAAGLLLAASANALQRAWLANFFERVVFHDDRSQAPLLGTDDFGQQNVALTPSNLAAAIVASGAIPLLLAGVQNVPNAPAGVYRDGGITDYHLDLPLAPSDGLCLYPHFYSTLTPGWFDKRLRRRRVLARNFDRVILLAPDSQFVAALPGAKIPDRTDFTELSNSERQLRWRQVAKESQRLGDEFAEHIANETLHTIAEPLSVQR